MEAHVLEDSMSLFILCNTVVQPVRAIIVATFTEMHKVHKSSNSCTHQEPAHSANRVLGQRGRVEPFASGTAVHQDYSHEAPKTATIEVVDAIAVGSQLYNIPSLFILIQL